MGASDLPLSGAVVLSCPAVRVHVSNADGERVVEIESASNGRVRAIVDGQAVEAEVQNTGSALLLVSEGRTLEIVAAGRGTAVSMWTRSGEIAVEVLDDRQVAARAARARGARAAEAVLRSPMPGRVVKVMCVPGDAVERGQGLVIVEAMKMENELGSPASGRVKKVLVEAGRTVEGGQALVELEG